MKTVYSLIGLVTFSLLTGSGPALGGAPVPPPDLRPMLQHEEMIVGEVAFNSREWLRVEYLTNHLGRALVRTNRAYVELANGLYYKERGEWKETQETIEVLPSGGGAAIHGQHKVYFPADIYRGLIEIVTPQGQRLRSRPLGISYFDGSNSVLIAELTNSIGQILPTGNQVIWTNAFTDFQADLVATYRRDGFECDLVFRERPPGPEEWGFNPETTRLQLLTEWFETPEPEMEAGRVDRQNGLQDTRVKFGSMQFGEGMAFGVGVREKHADQSGPEGTQEAPVYKSWQKLEGNRTFLIEELPYQQIKSRLEELPAAGPIGSGLSARVSPPRQPSTRRWLPSARPVQPGDGSILFASADQVMRPGVVMDYTTVISQNGYTFQGDTTYYVNGAVTLSGTVNFEGGAVLKYAVNGALYLSWPVTLNWQATSYRPVVFTAKDDNSVGDTIIGSTGNPQGNYATYALSITGSGSGASSFALNNFRIAHATTAIYASGISIDVSLSNGQLVNCSSGIYSPGQAQLNLYNMLFAKVQTAFVLSLANAHAQNVTFDAMPPSPPSYMPSFLLMPAYSANSMVLNLVNCVVANISLDSPANPGALSGDHNGFYNSPAFGTSPIVSVASPFQIKGAGNYYLNDACGFRNAGTANISAGLASDLRRKTTFPPANTPTFVPSGTTWNPTAPRDTDTPDLGFHYDPLDYWCSEYAMYGAPHTLVSGVAVGFYGPSGFVIQSGGGIKVEGRPDNMNRLVWYPAVQEQPIRINGVSTAGSALFNITSASGGPKLINMRFTDMPMQGRRQPFFDFGIPYYWPIATLRDCWLRGVNLTVGSFYNDGPPASSITLQNNLIERSTVSLFNGYIHYYYGPGQYNVYQNPLSAFLYNNLFWGGTLGLTYMDSEDQYHPGWGIQDNLFDSCAVTFSGDGGYLSRVPRSNNAYYNTATAPPPNGLQEAAPIVLTGVTYASTPTGLGPWYIGSTQPPLALQDTGSRLASSAGLYHYTTQTSQSKEADSQVDIGFHYVAASGLPQDTGARAVFVGTDTTTQGGWKGKYGAEGYNVIMDSTSYPAYAQVSVSGQASYVWNPSTTDARALQKSGASDRIAACWYSESQFTVSLNLAGTKFHRVAFYCLDWDAIARAETIEIRDAVSGALLASQAVSGFTSGKYLIWDLRGNVTVKFILTGSVNAVLSGIFLSTPDQALVDTDGDGLPDYLEDTTGNGVYNTGDLANWKSSDTDGDNVSDFNEWLQGRNLLSPNVGVDTTGTYISLQVY